MMKNLLLILTVLVFTSFQAQNTAFADSMRWYQGSGLYVSIESNDFNNDGKIDLLSYRFQGSAFCHLQTTPNSFSSTPISYTNTQDYIGSKDFNNDGNIDLLTSTYFYSGLGNGSFNKITLTQTITPPYSSIPLLNDFNNNGIIDVIITSGNKFEIFSGIGNGNFNSPININTANFDYVNSALINTDPNLDLLATSTNSSSTTFTVFTGNGNFQFNIISTFSISGIINSVSLSDFNNDAKIDIVVRTPTGFQTLIGDGAGNFSIGTSLNLISNIYSIADMNNDGKSDIISIHQNQTPFGVGITPTLSINYNDGTGNFTNSTTYTYSSQGNGLISLVINDLNNDFANDIAVTSYSVGAQQHILYTNKNSIYPGDANSDGIANNNDILELGLHMGLTGAVRTPTSNAWNSFTCTPWTGTITTGKNMNHSDCNGDGSINLSDTLAVFNNYGFMHNLKETAPTSTPQISIVPDQSIVFKNTWGTASIYVGDATTPVNNINGVAFTVSFNKTLIQPDSVYIEYIPSFINSNNLHFRKRVFNNGEIYTATTHTVNNNVSGNGKIAILHYKIKPNLVSDSTLNLAIIKASKMDGSGNLSSLTSGTGSLTASASALGLSELNSENSVMVYPNPNNGIITILSSEPQSNDELIMYNSLGQEVYKNKINGRQQTLNLNLAKGIYSYKIHRENMILKQSKIVIE